MTVLNPRDFYLEVQKGNIPGHSIIHKFGRNDAVPNGTWEFVNLLGFTAWPLSAATTVRVKAGGHAGDISTGQGARQVIAQGIDSTLVEIEEQIATNGIAASAATTALFWRVHRAWVHEVGAASYGGANKGPVTIENSGGGTDLIQIATEEGQSQFGGFSIPTGKTGYLLSVNLTVDASKAADLKLMTREEFNDAAGVVKPVRIKKYWDGVLGQMLFVPRSPGVLQALTDVWIEARGGGALTEVSVDMEFLLVDD